MYAWMSPEMKYSSEDCTTIKSVLNSLKFLRSSFQRDTVIGNLHSMRTSMLMSVLRSIPGRGCSDLSRLIYSDK
jgi:hypothetical protein